MASIGGIAVTTMTGSPTPPAEAYEPISPRAGEDGTRYKLVGQRTRQAVLQTLTVITGGSLAADLAAARAAQLALQGTAVSVLDAHGNTHANCAVLAVSPDGGRRVRGLSGDEIWLHTTWIVEQGAAD